jgi:TM2 domain-containing membrane protein YozV
MPFCESCGASLAGTFCSRCGKPAVVLNTDTAAAEQAADKLTPEERQHIYLEEKARFEIRQQLEASGAALRPPTVVVQSRPSNGVAAVLSLFIPGAGQMYKGKIGWGIAWLLCTVLGYTTIMYSWKNPDGSNMSAMFQNGELVSKAQFGLP